MANDTTSPNMGLTVPTVGVDPGPDWASSINADLSVIDGHNHSPGSGVQVNPTGLDINSDLPFGGNNATLLRSVRFSPQASPLALTTDIGCIYESGVDLFYNDGNGNQVRITQNGSVAGSTGSISGLTPPASASYVSLSQTFVWQSGVNTPANTDTASVILRNLTANSKGLTLSPPNAMSSNYSIVLPSLPAATSLLNIDSSGNMGITSMNSLVPTGAAIPFTGSSIPGGFLLCNGAAVSRSTYSALFSQIGITYGPGDGSTTFNVPTANNILSFSTITPVIPPQIQSYWHMDGLSGAGETNVLASPAYDLSDVGTVPSVTGLLPIGAPKARGAFLNSPNTALFWPAAGSSSTPFDSLIFAVDFFFFIVNPISGTMIGKSNRSSTGWVVYVDGADDHVSAYCPGPLNRLDGGPVSAYNDGKWHHLAFVNFATSGANKAQLYIDAILKDSATGYNLTPATQDLVVGNKFDFTDQFNGYIDDLAYWSSVPSQASFQNTITARWNGGLGSLYNAASQINVPYIIKT